VDLILLCQFSLLLHSDLDVQPLSEITVWRDWFSRSTERHFVTVIAVIAAWLQPLGSSCTFCYSKLDEKMCWRSLL